MTSLLCFPCFQFHYVLDHLLSVNYSLFYLISHFLHSLRLYLNAVQLLSQMLIYFALLIAQLFHYAVSQHLLAITVFSFPLAASFFLRAIGPLIFFMVRAIIFTQHHFCWHSIWLTFARMFDFLLFIFYSPFGALLIFFLWISSASINCNIWIGLINYEVIEKLNRNSIRIMKI